jgi:hypothetical protein
MFVASAGAVDIAIEKAAAMWMKRESQGENKYETPVEETNTSVNFVTKFANGCACNRKDLKKSSPSFSDEQKVLFNHDKQAKVEHPIGRDTTSASIKAFKTILILCLIPFWLGDQWRRFPAARDRSNESWAYQRTWNSGDVNACLAYVSEQSDVTGVFSDSNLHATGGYALLHQDVPLFTMIMFEFVEFEPSKVGMGFFSSSIT